MPKRGLHPGPSRSSGVRGAGAYSCRSSSASAASSAALSTAPSTALTGAPASLCRGAGRMTGDRTGESADNEEVVRGQGTWSYRCECRLGSVCRQALELSPVNRWSSVGTTCGATSNKGMESWSWHECTGSDTKHSWCWASVVSVVPVNMHTTLAHPGVHICTASIYVDVYTRTTCHSPKHAGGSPCSAQTS